MAVRKKISTKKLDNDSPVSTVSEKPAAVTTTPGPAKKKAVSKKAAVSAKKKVARTRTSPAANTKTTSKKAADPHKKAAFSSANAAKPVISKLQRQQMTGEAAYLISLKRPPGQGNSDSDWIAAETVIDMIFDVAN